VELHLAGIPGKEHILDDIRVNLRNDESRGYADYFHWALGFNGWLGLYNLYSSYVALLFERQAWPFVMDFTTASWDRLGVHRDQGFDHEFKFHKLNLIISQTSKQKQMKFGNQGEKS
jgi:hypothetical protein